VRVTPLRAFLFSLLFGDCQAFTFLPLLTHFHTLTPGGAMHCNIAQLVEVRYAPVFVPASMGCSIAVWVCRHRAVLLLYRFPFLRLPLPGHLPCSINKVSGATRLNTLRQPPVAVGILTT